MTFLGWRSLQELQVPARFAAPAAFFVDVGSEGFGHKQISPGLLSGCVPDNRDMSSGFHR